MSSILRVAGSWGLRGRQALEDIPASPSSYMQLFSRSRLRKVSWGALQPTFLWQAVWNPVLLNPSSTKEDIAVSYWRDEFRNGVEKTKHLCLKSLVGVKKKHCSFSKKYCPVCNTNFFFTFKKHSALQPDIIFMLAYFCEEDYFV